MFGVPFDRLHFQSYGLFRNCETKTDTRSNIRCKCKKISRNKIMHFFVLRYVWCSREFGYRVCIECVRKVRCRAFMFQWVVLSAWLHYISLAPGYSAYSTYVGFIVEHRARFESVNTVFAEYFCKTIRNVFAVLSLSHYLDDELIIIYRMEGATFGGNSNT